MRRSDGGRLFHMDGAATLTKVGSCPYDGCSPTSSGTKATSVAVSVCKMNQVA